jgi:flagellar biogenesis protein FliO
MIDGPVLGTLVRLVVSLATVLTLMVFLARYLRHRQLGTGVGGAQRRKKALALEVVTRQGLSRGSSLAVVRVSGQLLLLGVTESTVSVLRELEDVDELELPQDAQDSSPAALRPSGRDFAGSVVETLRQRTVRRG